jgi:hypothetical protein
MDPPEKYRPEASLYLKKRAAKDVALPATNGCDGETGGDVLGVACHDSSGRDHGDTHRGVGNVLSRVPRDVAPEGVAPAPSIDEQALNRTVNNSGPFGTACLRTRWTI